MVSDRASIFHIYIPWVKPFSTKVKVICQGHVSRSEFFKKWLLRGHSCFTNTSCFKLSDNRWLVNLKNCRPIRLAEICFTINGLFTKVFQVCWPSGSRAIVMALYPSCVPLSMIFSFKFYLLKLLNDFKLNFT